MARRVRLEEGIVGESCSTNSSTIMRPLKCQNIEDQTTRASVMGVISTGGQLRSKLKLVDAKLSALSLLAGEGISIQWVMFLTGCPEKKSIQCGWGLSSAQMPRTAFPPANSRTGSRVLGIVIHIGRQQN